LDQQQPVVDLGLGVLAIGGASEQVLAQTVTAGISGDLAEVQLPASCSPGSYLLVQIEEVAGGTPNGVVLASELSAGTDLAGGGIFNAIDFSHPALVSAGSHFAIVLTSTGSCFVYQGPSGDSYAWGNLFFIALPNPLDVWVCVCEFAGASFDLPFKTFVSGAEQQLADLAAAAAGVGPAKSLVNKVRRAQGYLAAGDVSHSCSTLTAFVKEVRALSGKKIPSEDAAALIAQTQRIKAVLGC
jgi:hypothetical protein